MPSTVSHPLDLSVVVPSYGRCDSLARVVRALARQSEVNLEIIVVDQNPEGWLLENLPAELREAATFLHLDEPNCSTARNVGFLASRAPFVVFMDDDIVPSPDFCRRALDTLQHHPEIRCLVPVVFSDDTGVEAALEGYSGLKVAEHAGARSLWRIRDTLGAVVFFDRRGFEESGGYDELLYRYARASEDHELFRRMAKRGIELWLDTGLAVFHDEKVPGGAELRTIAREKNRERCVRGWTFKAWAHSGSPDLALDQAAYLLRSALLNRRALARPTQTIRELRVLLQAAREVRALLVEHQVELRGVHAVDHLCRHRAKPARPDW